MNNLTTNELKLNKLINEMKTDLVLLQRDKELKKVLQYVSTISQDGDLEKLLKTIKLKFPEYGN